MRLFLPATISTKKVVYVAWYELKTIGQMKRQATAVLITKRNLYFFWTLETSETWLSDKWYIGQMDVLDFINYWKSAMWDNRDLEQVADPFSLVS